VAQIWESAPNPQKQGKTVVLSEDDMTEEMTSVLRAWLEATQ
jgi:hypothetical protein